MKFTTMKVFQEVALRHMTPEQGADILIRQDREESWFFRLRKRLGLVPYRPADVQCEKCLRWREPIELYSSHLLWASKDGVLLCPTCLESRSWEEYCKSEDDALGGPIHGEHVEQQ